MTTRISDIVRRIIRGPVYVSALAAASGAIHAQDQDALEEVVITSKIVLLENDAFGATKMGLSLKDTPQSVTVITSDLIDIAGMQTFNDFYKVDASGGTAHTMDGFPRNYYRGFRQQGDNAIRVDGFRTPGEIDLDLSLFDRYEVIKGPTSTLYGQNSIGGTLNAVSKLPQNEFKGSVGMEAADHNEYRVDVDLTGPLFGSDQWSYRLIGAYQDGDSFLDFAFERIKVGSFALQYQPSPATTLRLRTIYQRTDQRFHFAPVLQAAGDGTADPRDAVVTDGWQIPDVPRSRFYGMPWNIGSKEAQFVQFQGDHDFANGWKLRGLAQYNNIKGYLDGFLPVGPIDQNGFAYFASAYELGSEDSLYGAEVNLFGDVELFGREHTLFFGLDQNRIPSRADYSVSYFADGYNTHFFNAYRPDYSLIPVFDERSDYAYLYDEDSETELFGATVQLIAHPTDRVSVLLGARYSHDTSVVRERNGVIGTGDENGPFVVADDVSFSEMTFQTGVTFELNDSINLYASWGETFEPTFNYLANGALIPPEEGTNLEFGVKADLGKDLSMTAAVFRMERTNIAEADRDNPGSSLAIGTQRGQGVELGVQGRLLPELSLFASVAYLDAQFTEGEFNGLQPANAPRFGVSAFGSYEILQGGLKGLGFGLGVVHKSGIEGFDAGYTRAFGTPVTFDFGGFTEVDTRMFYSRDKWDFSVAVTNVFDEEYYSQTFTFLTFATHVNPPRTLRATVSYEF